MDYAKSKTCCKGEIWGMEKPRDKKFHSLWFVIQEYLTFSKFLRSLKYRLVLVF